MFMIEIFGKSYITDKEASNRYGFSQRWFIAKRHKGGGPKFIQINDNGRVLYPLEETDLWFKEKMMEKE